MSGQYGEVVTLLAKKQQKTTIGTEGRKVSSPGLHQAVNHPQPLSPPPSQYTTFFREGLTLQEKMKLSSLSLLVLLATACLRLGDSTNPPLYRSPYEPNNAFGFLLNSGQCSTTYQYKFIKVDCITCAYQVYRWLFFGLCCSAFGMRLCPALDTP